MRSIGYWPIDVPFPVVLTDEQLMLVLNVKKTAFYQRKAMRAYEGFLCLPKLTARARYSGELVQRWAFANNVGMHRTRSRNAA